ncbi:preprotein translocase subunit SecY [Staphylococcus simulans]
MINTKVKILHKRILFTLFILSIYILGSNISIIGDNQVKKNEDHFLKLAISNVGGDLSILNVFSLGLGPWLTAMIILMIFNYRDVDNVIKQTRLEKQIKERVLTISISLIQSYYVINNYISYNIIKEVSFIIILLILLTGTMLLVWLAEQNTIYGIAGPMPIVLMSLIKSLFQQQFQSIQLSNTLIIIMISLVIALIILLYIELSEYRLYYYDILNIPTQKDNSYISWKLNPSGSISIMLTLSLFLLLNNLSNLFLGTFFNNIHISFFSFDNPIGITIYIIMQIILGYLFSRFLINTKRKSKLFLKNGNYFINIEPGKATDEYLNIKARRICWFGSIVIGIILAVPLYSSLLIPELSKEIYFSIQLIILIYISITIIETIRTYLYFDSYKSILNKYLEE